MASIDDEAPFGMNSVAVIDVQELQGGSRHRVGVALWQPRKHSLTEDALPLDAKRSAPSYTITLFAFEEESNDFLSLDALIVREKPSWSYLRLSGIGVTEQHKVQEVMARSSVNCAVPVRGDAAFRWPHQDPTRRAETEAELAGALNAANLNGHSEVMSVGQIALNALYCLMSEMRPLGLLTSSEADQEFGGGGGDGAEQAPTSFHELKVGNLGSCLRLDSAAAEAIMLLPDKKGAPQQPHSSLFAVLNKCKTAMGSRLLDRWLRQPLVDRTAIEARHDLVERFVSDVSLRGDLVDALKNAPDLDAIVAKLRRNSAAAAAAAAAAGSDVRAGGGGGKGASKGGRSVATLLDVHRLYLFAVHNLPAFQAAIEASAENEEGGAELESCSGGGSSGGGGTEGSGTLGVLQGRFVEPLRQCDADLSNFKQLVEHVLDFEALPELRIKPQHRPELMELAEERDQAYGAVQELCEAVQDEWGSANGKGTIRLEAHKEEGFAMRLPQASDEQLLRREIPQVAIVSILKSGVVFTTDEFRSAAQEYVDVNLRYEEEQRTVVDKVVATAATYVPVSESAARLVAELDVLLSFAHVAAHCPSGDYVRPRFVNDDDPEARIKLVGARHPCVELQDGVSFIANDYDFGKSDSRFQIITGPNMGGKSTYIRGLGSLVAMAQAGSFVPCTEATLPLVDAILARVGAGDSQARGLSTFMAEMLEASTIVRTATDKSLVIVDELGRGTSTFDGFGLAWAISQHLVTSVGCWTIFATHFHELTLLANEERAVVNRHVTAHVDEESDEVTFLYEVQPGPCLQSYGVHVARMAQFPKSVIACAAAKAAELEGPSAAKGGASVSSSSLSSSTPSSKRQRLGTSGSDVNSSLAKLTAQAKELPLDSLSARGRTDEVRKLAEAAGLL